MDILEFGSILNLLRFVVLAVCLQIISSVLKKSDRSLALVLTRGRPDHPIDFQHPFLATPGFQTLTAQCDEAELVHRVEFFTSTGQVTCIRTSKCRVWFCGQYRIVCFG